MRCKLHPVLRQLGPSIGARFTSPSVALTMHEREIRAHGRRTSLAARASRGVRAPRQVCMTEGVAWLNCDGRMYEAPCVKTTSSHRRMPDFWSARAAHAAPRGHAPALHDVLVVTCLRTPTSAVAGQPAWQPHHNAAWK